MTYDFNLTAKYGDQINEFIHISCLPTVSAKVEATTEFIKNNMIAVGDVPVTAKGRLTYEAWLKVADMLRDMGVIPGKPDPALVDVLGKDDEEFAMELESAGIEDGVTLKESVAQIDIPKEEPKKYPKAVEEVLRKARELPEIDYGNSKDDYIFER